MKKYLILAASAIVALPALCQDTRPAELATADQRLNAAYRGVLTKMNTADQAKLKQAQRAWIAFRDADCAWARAGVPLDCLIDRTVARAEELEEEWFYDKDGKYIQAGGGNARQR